MVVFQDLRITPDGKTLCIDAIVAPYSYYEGEYIEALTIDTEDTFSPSGPSSNPVYATGFSEQAKQQSLILKAEQFGWDDFSGHILYVYVTVGGAPDSSTPCGWDSVNTLGVVLWWQPIYQMGINCMQKVVDDCCDISREFIDYALRLKAFELALRTAQYPVANARFKEWFSNTEKLVYKSPCGCK